MIIPIGFTNAQVFKDTTINRTCDLLVNCIAEYKDSGVASDFCFYGPASEIFQGGQLQTVNVIKFITGRSRLYRILLEKALTQLKAAQIVKQRNVVLFTVGGVFFEVHKSAHIIATTVVNGVLCYDYTPLAQDNQPLDPDPQPGETGYTLPLIKQ